MKLIVSTGHQHGKRGIPHTHAYHPARTGHIHAKEAHGPADFVGCQRFVE